MNGYQVRFEHGRGHRMIVEGEPPIRPEELDRLQLRMLIPSAFPGLLRFEAEEMDGAVAFRYSLSGKRMLAAKLRSGRWTMGEALATLCRLAEILEQGREYMLDLERYALDDEWMFIGEEEHDLALVYMPIEGRRSPGSIADAFEKLIVRWLMNVKMPDGSVLQRLLQLTASPDFSPGSLLRLTREYLTKWAVNGEPSGERMVAVQAVDMPSRSPELPEAFACQARPSEERSRDSAPVADRMAAAQLAEARKPDAEAKPPSRLPFVDPHSLSGLLGAEQQAKSPPKNAAPEAAADTSRRKVMLFGGAVVVLALVWKFLYVPHPDRRSLLMATGLSLLAVAAAFWMWKKSGLVGTNRSLSADRGDGADGLKQLNGKGGVPGPSGGSHRMAPEPQANRWPLAGADASGEDGRWAEAEARADFGRSEGRSGARWPSPFRGSAERFGDGAGSAQANDSPNVYGRASAQGGIVGSPEDWTGIEANPEMGERREAQAAWASGPGEEQRSDDSVSFEEKTSWLSEDRNVTALLTEDRAIFGKAPYLEWEAGGVKRKVHLQGESVVIGRSKEAAQHVDETQGVSRAHLELMPSDGTWQARDLGSRNGSWLNGVPMAPYESYPLREGDSIQIASSLYRFNHG